MEKRAASSTLLMMLSLEAPLLVVVAAAGLSTAAAISSSGDDMGIIRLPSSGGTARSGTEEAKKKRNDGQERPWKCCDRAVPGPTEGTTLVWYCMDKVEHCTCKACHKLEDSNLYYCLDGYEGSDPGPTCTAHP